ncbi:hypothetical protein B0H10DRAFT_2230627 [Mycena sp. CBHHK59/15]|nr:hypothetical protein B0H10DRAFT_2230627 [Mycena sp. CBHHK59/15]
MLVDAFSACSIGVSVATDGTQYQTEVFAASHLPAALSALQVHTCSAHGPSNRFPAGTVPFEKSLSSDNCPRCTDTCPCDYCCTQRGTTYRPLDGAIKGHRPSGLAKVVKSPRTAKPNPTSTHKPKPTITRTRIIAPPEPALDQMVIDPVVPYAIMYNFDDEPIAYTYFGVDKNDEAITDVVVAKPMKFRRVFVGAVQESWNLAPDAVIFVDPLVRPSKRKNPVVADAPPEMVDEPRATDQDQGEDQDQDQDQDEVPSNTDVHSSPLSSSSPSPPPPNRIPDPDEVDSADPPPLSNVLQAGDDEGSNEMEDVPMPLVEYSDSDDDSSPTDEPRPTGTGKDEVPSNPEADSSPLSSPPSPAPDAALSPLILEGVNSVDLPLPPERDSSPLSSLGPPSSPADLCNDI